MKEEGVRGGVTRVMAMADGWVCDPQGGVGGEKKAVCSFSLALSHSLLLTPWLVLVKARSARSGEKKKGFESQESGGDKV